MQVLKEVVKEKAVPAITHTHLLKAIIMSLLRAGAERSGVRNRAVLIFQQKGSNELSFLLKAVYLSCVQVLKEVVKEKAVPAITHTHLLKAIIMSLLRAGAERSGVRNRAVLIFQQKGSNELSFLLKAVYLSCVQVLKEVVKEKAVPTITVNNIQDVLSSGKLPVPSQQKREAPWGGEASLGVDSRRNVTQAVAKRGLAANASSKR